jgi:DNA modification methylase
MAGPDGTRPHRRTNVNPEALAVEWVPLDRLRCNLSNPRRNDPAVPHVAASLRRFGWRQPIVAKRSGEVVAGNTRLKAAQRMGMARVPVVWFDGSDTEATAYAVADNRTHEFSEWDERALADLLEELRAEDALEGVGYTDDDIDALIAELDADNSNASGLDDPGPSPPPLQPVTRPGDLLRLGQHRLLCGDATDPADLARLTDGRKAVLLATDPPYCVDYTGADRPQNSGKDWTAVYREVEIDDLGEFLTACFRAVLPHLRDDAAIYVWHAHRQYPVLDRVFEEFGILRHQPIVWVKPASTFTYSFYRWGHETCLFGWRKGHKPPHYLDNQLTSVWEVDWDGLQRLVGNEYPTQKPVRLFEIPMEQHTRPGAVVLEPFCGSGSQLIAAERLRRRCFALEICPAFVDVAIRRWEGATGREAVLDSTGKSFRQLTRERT